MCLYIETIRFQDGELKNLPYHQARFERTRQIELGLKSHPDLNQLIRNHKGWDTGLQKCRVLYKNEIEQIEFEPYSRRIIKSLKVVKADHVFYRYKYSDRSALDALFEQRGICDDILMVKNGCITDSYYANIAFWDGEGWFTPDTPMLAGTMRASLLEKGVLKMARITLGNMNYYQNIRLINAMNSLQDGEDIPLDSVEH